MTTFIVTTRSRGTVQLEAHDFAGLHAYALGEQGISSEDVIAVQPVPDPMGPMGALDFSRINDQQCTDIIYALQPEIQRLVEECAGRPELPEGWIENVTASVRGELEHQLRDTVRTLLTEEVALIRPLLEDALRTVIQEQQ